MRQSIADALSWQQALPPWALKCLINLSKDQEEQDRYVRVHSAVALGKQMPLPSQTREYLINMSQDQAEKDSYLRVYSARALGGQSVLYDETIACLINLLQEKDEVVRHEASRLLGEYPALPQVALNCLIDLLKHELNGIRDAAAYALSQQSVWRGYQWLSTGAPSLLKDLYIHWLIKQNFQQIVPLYIENNMLYFYQSMEKLKQVPLNDEAGFRQAIRDAQEAVGIPLASQVRAFQSTSLVQDDAVPLPRMYSMNTFK